MKIACLLGTLLLMAVLAGCNQPNNGETPPKGELPTPYPTQGTSAASATSAPAAGTTAKAASTASASSSSATPAAAGSSAPGSGQSAAATTSSR